MLVFYFLKSVFCNTNVHNISLNKALRVHVCLLFAFSVSGLLQIRKRMPFHSNIAMGKSRGPCVMCAKQHDMGPQEVCFAGGFHLSSTWDECQ